MVRWLVVPQNGDSDARRRGIVANALLLASLGLSILATLITLSEAAHLHKNYLGEPPLTSLTISLVLLLTYIWSRRKFSKITAGVLIAVFLGAGTYTLYQWGIMLPQGLLLYAFVVILSGILLGRQPAAWVAGLVVTLLLGLSYLQAYEFYDPDRRWVQHQPVFFDGVGFSATLLLIALVSWLYNLEVERLLSRTRKSELALKHERDVLESTVNERTRQLEQEQLKRLLELQRFSEFGRLSAGIMHDMANPVTAAVLNLDALAAEEHSDLLARAQNSIGHVGRYVAAARRQLMAQSESSKFSVVEEMELVLTILAHKSRKYHVQVNTKAVPPNLALFGDPVVFNQMIANLLSNAIEAYRDIPQKAGLPRDVLVEAVREADFVEIRVIDQGKGIAPGHDVFAPFYSTKNGTDGNMGLGLSIAKQMAEEIFHGSISGKSDAKHGTVFTVRIGSEHANI